MGGSRPRRTKRAQVSGNAPLSQNLQTNVEPRKRRDSDFRAVLFSAANLFGGSFDSRRWRNDNGSSELAAVTTPIARVKRGSDLARIMSSRELKLTWGPCKRTLTSLSAAALGRHSHCGSFSNRARRCEEGAALPHAIVRRTGKAEFPIPIVEPWHCMTGLSALRIPHAPTQLNLVAAQARISRHSKDRTCHREPSSRCTLRLSFLRRNGRNACRHCRHSSRAVPSMRRSLYWLGRVIVYLTPVSNP
jgi:hypothetical protein